MGGAIIAFNRRGTEAIAIVCLAVGCSSDKPAPARPTDAEASEVVADAASDASALSCRPFDGTWWGHAVAGIDDMGRAAITLDRNDGVWTCPYTLAGGPYEHVQLVWPSRADSGFAFFVILRRVGGELVSIGVGQNVEASTTDAGAGGDAGAPARVGVPVPIAGIATAVPIHSPPSSERVAHIYAARASTGQVVSTTFDGVAWSTPTDVAGVITSQPFVANPFAWVDSARRVQLRDSISGTDQVLGTASSGVTRIEYFEIGPATRYQQILWAGPDGRVTARRVGSTECTLPHCVCSEPWCITKEVLGANGGAIWLSEGSIRSYGITGFHAEPVTSEKALFATPVSNRLGVYVRASDCALRVVLGSGPRTVPNVGCAKQPSMI